MKLTDVTPNLIVSNIDRSIAFYRDVLGFNVTTTVPDASPFVFAWMQRDEVKVFLNAVEGVQHDVPALAQRAVGGTATLFIVLEASSAAEGVDAMFKAVDGKAKLVMPLKDQFYGLREFAVEDPDGYVIFFAQRLG
jgi:uncharacterized glyoxalase superfamily protein PhnB